MHPKIRTNHKMNPLERIDELKKRRVNLLLEMGRLDNEMDEIGLSICKDKHGDIGDVVDVTVGDRKESGEVVRFETNPLSCIPLCIVSVGRLGGMEFALRV